ncbi:NYN domain-containing protein [Paenimyroides tangerinum]|uniref:NYN domain-containing protein n=1 Tax=Paenimyroides tangerinum TaxID=2488728 RepID=A0A3P3WCN1_9FLAO|nr:NYN domain-containing protein [Paenimyroides tangerinum]RRJ90353.1 NYN domain-containing protein [Paenimyroides tangerinum]
MSEKKFNIAILIDGDNAQPKLLKETIEEVSKYGKATIRRIYGDWTSQAMNSWKALINQHSINPIQKFSYTTGKNSTDGALIIDAMDILHSKNVEGFCIVSSDSDYTGLAKRIREEGLFVMGIGEKKTPESFVQSCDIFTFTENITPKIVEVKEPEIKTNRVGTLSKSKIPKVTPKSKKKNSILSDKDNKTISRAFDISTDENEIAYISTVGANIRKIDPSFDTRTYNFATLSKLFENLDEYEVIRNEVGALNHPLVKRK